MARLAKNELFLDQIQPGVWKLYGQILGAQIRRKSTDLKKLEDLRDSLLKKVAPAAQDKHTLRSTWLSEGQLRDAESATLRANGRTLLDCVIHAKRSDDVQRPMGREAGVLEWMSQLEHRLKRFPATLTKNRTRVEAFFNACPAATKLHEFTSEDVEGWVFRKGIATNTQLTDGTVLSAFFKFAEKMSWVAKSPVTIDLKELAGRARRVERTRILTPTQCNALLEAAEGYDNGRLVPFVLLSTWCFMRNAEVLRTRPEDIDWDAKEPAVTTEPRKRRTVSYRRVPIPKNALKRLRKIREEKLWPDGSTVFWSRREWDQVRKIAGLIDVAPPANPKQKTHAKIADSVWQENILRHTGISYRYQQTGDISLVTREAGNSSTCRSQARRKFSTRPSAGGA
jgi:integrase